MSWLLPSNRKLRHLEGISLRNLTLSSPQLRPRTKPIDDEFLPNAFKSPAKLLAQQELRLSHSKSSEDLSIHGESAVVETKQNGQDASRRPAKPSARRRSTLNWVNETPVNRQAMLEEAVAERRPDTFFSLHEVGADLESMPLYISETREKCMNADFKFFSLKDCAPISREGELTVRVWSRFGKTERFTLLVELETHLASLTRIGKTLDAFFHPLPDNCVIFHLSDGIYTSFVDLPSLGSMLEALRGQPQTPRSATFPARSTSSFDALMKLKNLAECVEDAVNTRATITEQINSIIEENKNGSDEITSATVSKANAEAVQDAVKSIKRSISKLSDEKSTRSENLEMRRKAIVKQRREQEHGEASLRKDEATLQKRIDDHRQINFKVIGQTRRIAQHILDIFPIEPIEGKLLCFTVGGHFLPNAKTFENETAFDAEATAAALGHVGQIVTMLESKLAIALPYPITFRGSTSEIFDPLSPAQELGSTVKLPEGELPTRENSLFRVFPLYPKGTVLKRFNVGVYLLNKNIEELMSKRGLKVMDPRNTLANMKYLLTVLASGTGEMPNRKVGDIKGLSVRTRSVDSQNSQRVPSRLAWMEARVQHSL